ncbi:NADH kinase pos5 [Ascosphaera pollenicola]|nr:NADH kinase pos5 [Ascosphaera pollenicola]
MAAAVSRTWTLLPRANRVSWFARAIDHSRRAFCASASRRRIEDMRQLPNAITARYEGVRPPISTDIDTDLLSLRWNLAGQERRRPRNVLLVHKQFAPKVTAALLEVVKHIKETYPETNIVLEPETAQEVHDHLPCEIYTNIGSPEASIKNGGVIVSKQDDQPASGEALAILPEKIDLAVTLGGDGTVLRASSFFAETRRVPPFLCFGMGTLGFLGEWEIKDYEKVLKGAMHGNDGTVAAEDEDIQILVRRRIQIRVFDKDGKQRFILRDGMRISNTSQEDIRRHMANADEEAGVVHAMNEVVLHRGNQPHLAILEVSIGSRFLTEAVADGMIAATPTGSTAYSLSAGGSITPRSTSGNLIITGKGEGEAKQRNNHAIEREKSRQGDTCQYRRCDNGTGTERGDVSPGLGGKYQLD